MYVLVQVEFEKPVDAKGNIEVWLQRLVDGMQDTVKQVRFLFTSLASQHYSLSLVHVLQTSALLTNDWHPQSFLCLSFVALCVAVQVIKRAVRNVYEMGLEDFIFGHPAQIALLGIQYQWTADTQVSCCCCMYMQGCLLQSQSWSCAAGHLMHMCC